MSDSLSSRDNSAEERDEPHPSSAAGSKGTKTPRSPVERFLVWSLIAGLLVVVGIEGKGRLAYELDRRAILGAIRETEEASDTNAYVSAADVEQLVDSWSEREPMSELPANTIAASSADRFFYRGLFRDWQLYVYYGRADVDGTRAVIEITPEPVEKVTMDIRAIMENQSEEPDSIEDEAPPEPVSPDEEASPEPDN